MLYPDFEEFERLSQKGNLIPVYREILADTVHACDSISETGRFSVISA